MALSEIWELEVDGTRKSLAAWGFDAASLSFRSQTADVLQLSAPVADFGDLVDAGFVFDELAVLWRDDERFFTGRIGIAERKARGESELVSYRIWGPWADLEQLAFAQTWQSFTRGESATETPADLVDHPRFQLGVDPSGDRVSTITTLQEIISYAAAKGANVALGELTMEALYPKAFEMHSQSCAEVVRALLIWHPDVVAWWDYSTEVPTFRCTARSKAPGHLLNAGDRPVSQCNIKVRDDLVVENVIISYETVEHREDEDAGVESGVRLVVVKDSHPTEVVGRRSMFLTFALTPEEAAVAAGVEEKELKRQEASLGAALPRPTRGPEAKSHRQPVITKKLPKNGATNSYARRWWIRHTKLKGLKGHIEQEDIALVPTTADGLTAHTLTIIEDPDAEPLPPVTNPNATRPAKSETVADYPRELMLGPVPEWIRSLREVRMEAKATIGIKATVIRNLPADAKRYLQHHFGKEFKTFAGTRYLVCDKDVEFTATNAHTNVYHRPLSVRMGEPADESNVTDEQIEAAYDAARSKGETSPVVDGLAEALFKARSEAPVEGSWELTELEPGAIRYLGGALAFSHETRTEWAALKCLVQEEEIDIATGKTSLTFGLPRRLSAQNLREIMFDPARALQRAIGAATGSMFRDRRQADRADGTLPSLPFGSGSLSGVGGGGYSGGGAGGGSGGGESDRNPVMLPMVPDPKNESGDTGKIAAIRMWQPVDASEGETTKLGLVLNGATLKVGANFSVPLSIAGIDDAFPIGNDFRMYLDLTYASGNWSAVLKCDDAWDTDYFFILDGEGEPDKTRARYPIAVVKAAGSGSPDPGVLVLGDSGEFWVHPVAPESSLTMLDLYWPLPTKDGGRWMQFPWPLPGAQPS